MSTEPKQQELPDDLIRRALEGLFRDLHDDAGPADQDRRTSDFVFHMMDWKKDLLALAQLYQNPQNASGPEWDSAVRGMLIHASGHLNAAARIDGWEPVEFTLPEASQSVTGVEPSRVTPKPRQKAG